MFQHIATKCVSALSFSGCGETKERTKALTTTTTTTHGTPIYQLIQGAGAQGAGEPAGVQRVRLRPGPGALPPHLHQGPWYVRTYVRGLGRLGLRGGWTGTGLMSINTTCLNGNHAHDHYTRPQTATTWTRRRWNIPWTSTSRSPSRTSRCVRTCIHSCMGWLVGESLNHTLLNSTTTIVLQTNTQRTAGPRAVDRHHGPGTLRRGATRQPLPPPPAPGAIGWVLVNVVGFGVGSRFAHASVRSLTLSHT